MGDGNGERWGRRKGADECRTSPVEGKGEGKRCPTETSPFPLPEAGQCQQIETPSSSPLTGPLSFPDTPLEPEHLRVERT